MIKLKEFLESGLKSDETLNNVSIFIVEKDGVKRKYTVKEAVEKFQEESFSKWNLDCGRLLFYLD